MFRFFYHSSLLFLVHLFAVCPVFRTQTLTWSDILFWVKVGDDDEGGQSCLYHVCLRRRQGSIHEEAKSDIDRHSHERCEGRSLFEGWSGSLDSLSLSLSFSLTQEPVMRFLPPSQCFGSQVRSWGGNGRRTRHPRDFFFCRRRHVHYKEKDEKKSEIENRVHDSVKKRRMRTRTSTWIELSKALCVGGQSCCQNSFVLLFNNKNAGFSSRDWVVLSQLLFALVVSFRA